MIERDILDAAARKIAEKTGVPFDAILINATQHPSRALDRHNPRL